VIKVLVLGKDATLFPMQGAIGDTRKRHVIYADRLRRREPGSEIRIATYTPCKGGGRYDVPCDGLRIYGTRSYHRATFVFDLLLLLRRVLADGWRPDVVTVQTPWEEGLVGYVVARAVGARFIPQLHFDLFSQDWLNESRLNRWRRTVAKFVIRRADLVRVVSTALANGVVEQCAIPPARVRVAPVGVNFVPALGEKRQFKAQLAPRLEQRRIVLFVGRLCAQKNLSLWVDVARSVASRVPAAMFVIVGAGPDDVSIRRLVENVHLADRFLFLGRQPHDALPRIYAAADVFLLTSHYEGFGRVLLEALLSGVPVVSTACTGPEDLVQDGVNGYLLPRGDAVGLATKVSELLEDEQRACLFGLIAAQRMTKQFNIEALADRILDCWISR
jgi:glycosyltransferase involved in cell wall biosynthesis